MLQSDPPCLASFSCLIPAVTEISWNRNSFCKIYFFPIKIQQWYMYQSNLEKQLTQSHKSKEKRKEKNWLRKRFLAVKNFSDISHISNTQIHTKSISRCKNSNAEKKLLKKCYAMWIHHLCTFHSSKCVHIPHFIIDNYRGNVNNFVYTPSRFIQTILTCQFQQLRSPTKETKQKDMHSKQEQSPECGCMKVSSGWKCFYWVEEAM